MKNLRTALGAVILLAALVGCKSNEAQADPTANQVTPPKTQGGDKPARGPVGIKGTDLKPGGQAQFGGKAPN